LPARLFFTDVSEMDADLSTGAGDRPPIQYDRSARTLHLTLCEGAISITINGSVFDRVQVPEIT
jgi:hypothetical protein